jgi:acetyl-CoA acetyltransferase
MERPFAGPDGHVYLVSAARTSIGKFGGALASVPATELGGVAIREAVERGDLDRRRRSSTTLLLAQSTAVARCVS